MSKSSAKLNVTRPVNIFQKPLVVDLKGLFKALAKGVGHGVSGKWEEIASDAVETLSAIGLATEPGELGFLLIRRSLTQALFALVGENASHLLSPQETDETSIIDSFDSSITARETAIDAKFLDRPGDIALVSDVQALLIAWLAGHGLPDSTVIAITSRFPGYFVYALNQEWRQNAKSYAPLLAALETPFTKSGEREWAWAAYSALLQRRVQEGVFDEPFSLSQIFVPLNAYYLEHRPQRDSIDDMARISRNNRRIVVALQQELDLWLRSVDRDDSIRVISGGPGSGKSSFARIFAARVAHEQRIKVLFVPLHLIDPSKDFVEEIGRFVRDEGILLQNPIDSESTEPSLLIILDGLDELATQGKAAADTAKGFIRDVEKTLEKRNRQSLRLRILISGRELVVQDNESEFRRVRQVLTLLPYFVPGHSRRAAPYASDQNVGEENFEYSDPERLLEVDLRHTWWQTYGRLTGRNYERLPDELSRHDLEEITAQPLLNYLIALSFTRDKIDFTKDVGLNAIYEDLVAAVHERGYDQHRPYGPIRHMNCEEFARVLEEIGLAAWHGDGRTTSVREIEAHCRTSGVGQLLDKFQEGAEAGVTRLLAAFFFRQYGQRSTGDRTFVFTHKSFGEYLAARRIARAVTRVIKETDARAASPDEGWDEREALKRWAEICGPSAITQYIRTFLLNEIAQISLSRLIEQQNRLAKLFSFMLRHGTPMEQVIQGTFKEALFQSRNAEEGLLVALNAHGIATQQLSRIEVLGPTTFGTWYRRIQGQRSGPESVLAAICLSFLDLGNSILDICDLFGCNLWGSDLSNLTAHFAVLQMCDLHEANLSNGNLSYAHLSGTNLQAANLAGTNFLQAHLTSANLQQANLCRANLESANLVEANLQGADLSDARLTKANLRGANLDGANLNGTVFSKCILADVNFSNTIYAGLGPKGIRRLISSEE